eukprot:TRINITY_DN1225_c0_g2_i1.p1 TRINITY_DN1225_c0_g2~~TRINITY_DN1225_c0_g2_i1.p1  ORF type:complete len:313 (+),score=55.22 TRINITY_DN1225_c0_g2_i1:62-1000(+)
MKHAAARFSVVTGLAALTMGVKVNPNDFHENHLKHAALISSNASDSAPVDDSGILFLIRTGGPESKARVAAVKETWAKSLPGSSTVFFQKSEKCEKAWGDNHGEGLTCLESENELAISNTRNDFTWLAIVDDDVYVNVNNLNDALKKLNPSDKKVYGTPGCGHCNPAAGEGTSGFCGGGGYFISRENLKLITADNNAFSQSFNRKPDQEWCDVRFACAASTRGLQMQQLNGLYPWAAKDAAEEHAQIHGGIPPLTFHYSGPNRMRRLDKEFNQGRSFMSLESESHAAVSLKRYRMALEKYVDEENRQRAKGK